LELSSASVTLRSGAVAVRIWVDAAADVVWLTGEGRPGRMVEVDTVVWRTGRRQLTGQEQHCLDAGAPYPVHSEPDTVPSLPGDFVGVCHHNASSRYGDSLELQGLAGFADGPGDPLLGRTFGYVAAGRNLTKLGPGRLVSTAGITRFDLRVVVLTRARSTIASWQEAALAASETAARSGPDRSWSHHLGWWKEFWQRSHLRLEGDETAQTITRGFALQRFLSACAGRGAYPIKFNGSLFTVDWAYPRGENPLQPDYPSEHFDCDYRRWGPGYWHQNTRLPYWVMLANGDFEMLEPFFAMYREALPLARHRVAVHCRHGGAVFPEAMTFWGGYLNHHYGWPGQRDAGLEGHLAQNPYMRRHHSSILEVAYLALQVFRFTGNDRFLEDTAVPLAVGALEYYAARFTGKSGSFRIAPAQCLEQWWVAENPLPDIAGLRAVAEGLLQLGAVAPPAVRTLAGSLLSHLPDLPMTMRAGKRFFAPAETWESVPRNRETPELYGVFPFFCCRKNSGDFAIARRTYRHRIYRDDFGWMQDGILAALLGFADEAISSISRRLGTPPEIARFPAFWGPNWDWIPDQDHGCVAALALQFLALRTPQALTRRGWRYAFRLHHGFPVEPSRSAPAVRLIERSTL
jgi:hypothetical protein